MQRMIKKLLLLYGDGAMTAGMAFEALNHARIYQANLLVILNDNQMSISENVGGLRNYLSRIWASRTYNKIRDGGKTVLTFVPAARAFVRKAEIHAKGMVAPGALFEELGFEYIGPVDGHDVVALTKILQDIKRLKGPRFLHIKTTKGKGFAPAEKDQIGFHAINKIKRKDSAQESKNTELSTPSYSEVFGEWLCYKAKQDERLMAITPAMREGSGMVQFSKDFPDRYFDVAIAEQHSVTFAAGLACEGLKPVVAIYSTFLQRAYAARHRTPRKRTRNLPRNQTYWCRRCNPSRSFRPFLLKMRSQYGHNDSIERRHSMENAEHRI